MNQTKEKCPGTAATVQSTSDYIQFQNSTGERDCKAFPHGRIYTEAEMNAELDALEVKTGETMDTRFREIFNLLGKAGIFDAFCEVAAEKPEDRQPDDERFEEALREARRRVSA